MGKNLKNWSYLGGYFTNRLHTWYQGTTQLGAFNDPSADDLDPRSKVKVKFSKKWVKNQRIGYISEAISPTDFILVPRYKPIRHIQ